MPGDIKIPFVPPTFSWNSRNLYSNFKLFKQKVEIAFKGQFKDCDDIAKVGAILNWLGNNAYEVYENLHLEEAAHKDNPDCILKALEKYFKPEQNQIPLLVHPMQYLHDSSNVSMPS